LPLQAWPLQPNQPRRDSDGRSLRLGPQPTRSQWHRPEPTQPLPSHSEPERPGRWGPDSPGLGPDLQRPDLQWVPVPTSGLKTTSGLYASRWTEDSHWTAGHYAAGLMCTSGLKAQVTHTHTHTHTHTTHTHSGKPNPPCAAARNGCAALRFSAWTAVLSGAAMSSV